MTREMRDVTATAAVVGRLMRTVVVMVTLQLHLVDAGQYFGTQQGSRTWQTSPPGLNSQ